MEFALLSNSLVVCKKAYKNIQLSRIEYLKEIIKVIWHIYYIIIFFIYQYIL